MTESFVLNLGRSGTVVNVNATPNDYNNYTSSDDLIIKGYIKTELSNGNVNNPEIHISGDDIKKYMIGLLKAADPALEINSENVVITVEAVEPDSEESEVVISISDREPSPEQ